MKRMDRTQFFDRLSPLDEERLKKALWNLYWRGSATMRERIESELDPDMPGQHRRAAPESVDPEWTRHKVEEFVELARVGAYIASDRRVTPRERTRWRFTFQRLVKDAGIALRDDDIEDGAAAMEMLLDLAQEVRSYDYFRSEDPIEAARIVVSDEVALLWSRVQEQRGFAEFVRSAAPQLLRWESEFGWTRTGFGRIREKETSLATVLDRMLSVPDAWITFADAHLDALDASSAMAPRRDRYSPDRSRQDRAKNLAEWHSMLLVRLTDGEAEDRLDRLAEHPALGGPDHTFFRAQLARARNDLATARRLTTEALEKLPGHRDYLRFAGEIGAPRPARAEAAQARIERLMAKD